VAADGSEKWRVSLAGGDILDTPIIGRDGTLYVGTYFYTGRYYAIRGQNPPAPASPWPMYGHDVRNSGMSEYEGPSATRYAKWSLAIPKSVSTSVMGPDGTVYMGTYNGLYALNPDGSIKWTFVGVLAQVNSTPAVDRDGMIYVGIGGYLYAIAPDGTERWKQATGWQVISPPTIAQDGIVYVGDRDGHVYAVDPQAIDPTDRLVWKSAYIGSVDYNAPAVSRDGGTLYITSRYLSDASVGALAAIDVDTGSLDWQVPTPGGISLMSSPVVGDDGTVYFGSRNSHVYAINPDGSEQWRFKTGGGIDATPSLGADGTVYVGSMDNHLYALNPDGTEKWRFATQGDVRAMAAIGSSGTLYFGDSSGRLYSVNANGSENWRTYLSGGAILDTPIIAPDDTLYAGTYYNSGRFYAFGVSEPDPYFGQCIFQFPQIPQHYIDDYDEGMEWGTNNTYFNVVWNGHLIFELIPVSRVDAYGRPYWETDGYRYTRGDFVAYEDEWGVNDWEVCKTSAGTLAPVP
jgi:outer membrane protein assembly factor BamB